VIQGGDAASVQPHAPNVPAPKMHSRMVTKRYPEDLTVSITLGTTSMLWDTRSCCKWMILSGRLADITSFTCATNASAVVAPLASWWSTVSAVHTHTAPTAQTRTDEARTERRKPNTRPGLHRQCIPASALSCQQPNTCHKLTHNAPRFQLTTW